MQYFQNRRHTLKVSEGEIEEAFKAIADHFSYKWIKSPGSHPLQSLWQRRDVLSTNELFFFGTLLNSLSKIDKKWTEGQVKKIKLDQSNNRLGAFFEITGIGMLISPDQSIKPAKNDQPGYDGILKMTQEKEMRLSLKNYGDSYSYKEFTEYAQNTEAIIKTILKEKSVISVQIIIDFSTNYPSKADWNSLNEMLPEMLSNVRKGEPRFFFKEDVWFLGYGDLKDEEQEFYAYENSYTLMVTSPYHKNEEQNLLSKLDEACANLSKHSKLQDEKVINTVFVHLPELASIEKCKQWVLDYYRDFPDKPIGAVLLWQPLVANDLEKDVSFINHHFEFILKENVYSAWNTFGRSIHFNLPVGMINNVSPKNKLVVESEGRTQVIDINDRYFYQKGELFLAAKKSEDGSATGNTNRIAPGIISKSVFQPFADQPGFIIEAIVPPVDKLLII